MGYEQIVYHIFYFFHFFQQIQYINHRHVYYYYYINGILAISIAKSTTALQFTKSSTSIILPIKSVLCFANQISNSFCAYLAKSMIDFGRFGNIELIIVSAYT